MTDKNMLKKFRQLGSTNKTTNEEIEKVFLLSKKERDEMRMLRRENVFNYLDTKHRREMRMIKNNDWEGLKKLFE